MTNKPLWSRTQQTSNNPKPPKNFPFTQFLDIVALSLWTIYLAAGNIQGDRDWTAAIVIPLGLAILIWMFLRRHTLRITALVMAVGCAAITGETRASILGFSVLGATLLYVVEVIASTRDEKENTTASGTLAPLVFGGVLLAYMIFRYYEWESSFVQVHDNLDGNLTRYMIMAQSPVFAPMTAKIPQLMGGLPKNSLHSDLTYYAILFRFFPPFFAYVLHEATMRAVAFLGMALLLGRKIIPSASPWIIFGAAACFALVPFWPGGSLNVAGQPLLFLALMQIYARQATWRDWSVIVLFPAASSLIMVGWLLILLVFLWSLLASIRAKQIHGPLATGCFILGVGYAIVNYRLLYLLLIDTAYQSHRLEFDVNWFLMIGRIETWHDVLQSFFRELVHGKYYIKPLQRPALILTYGITLLVSLVRLFPGRRLKGRIQEPGKEGKLSQDKRGLIGLLAILTLIFACTFIDVLGKYGPLKAWMLEQEIGAFRTINIRRVNRFVPILWYLGFAISLGILSSQTKRGLIVAILLIAFQLTRPFGHAFDSGHYRTMRYDAYYSPKLFAQVRDHIGKPQSSYRVVSLGMAPAIANYNGFYTIDAYLPNYPLEYKHRFRRIISKELEKKKRLRNIFDSWGGYCFVLSSELDPMNMHLNYAKRYNHPPLNDLELDREALQDLEVEYLMSALAIVHPEKSGLIFLKEFSEESAAWDVYLYEVRG